MSRSSRGIQNLAGACVGDRSFRFAFEHAEVGMALIDLQHWQWLEINAALCTLLGRARDALLAELTVGEFLLLRERKSQSERLDLERFLRAEIPAFCFERRWERGVGPELWLLVRVSAVRPPDQEGRPACAIAVVEDISEQKQVERELSARTAETAELAHALRYAPVLVRALDGRIRRWSDGARLLYGWSAAEALGRTSHELFATRFPEPVDQINENVLQKGLWRGELTHRRKDGEELIVSSLWTLRRNASAEAMHTVVEVNADITALRQSERSLRESEERLRSTFEQAAVGMAAVALDGRWRRVNGKLCAITGYSRDELLRMRFQDVTYAEDLDLDLDYIRPLLAGMISTYSMEKRYLRKDGAVIWVNITMALVRHEDGTPRYFVAVIEDIGARRAAEAEIRALTAGLERRVEERTHQLNEANQQLQAFAYTASHDLRAPLRAMEGFARILLEDHSEQLDALGRDCAQRIVAGASRLDALIGDLLAYSRLAQQAVERVPLSLDAIVPDVVQQFEGAVAAAGGGIAVGRPLGALLGQRTILSQALANLIANALKFVAPGTAPQIVIRSEFHGVRLRLWVEDNGIGIAPEHQARIFDVFERLHGAADYPGTGIGLAIVKKGIERLGGAVGVESEPGRGSRFWIELETAET